MKKATPEDIKNAVKKHYGITIDAVEKSTAKTWNECYKLVAKDKEYFLKRLTPYSGFEAQHIYAQFDIARHLKKKGIPTILPIKNNRGEELSVDKSGNYILFEHHDIEDGDQHNNMHFNESVKVLAQFHEAMKDFKTKNEFSVDPMDESVSDILYFDLDDTTKWNRDNVVKLAKQKQTPFAKQVLTDAPMIKHAIIKVVAALPKLQYTEKTMLHFDLRASNLFYKDDQFFALSDFEHSHRGYIEYDIVRAAKYWAEKEDGTFDIMRFKRFIYLYNKKRKCSMDWKLYFTLILFVILRRLIYAALRYMKDGIMGDLYELDRKTLQFLLENEKEF